MLNKRITAALLRLSEMPWPALTQLKKWMRPPINGLEVNFNEPSLRAAFSTDEQGDILSYCPVQQVLVASAFVISPTATGEQARNAGNEMDLAIANYAEMNGISKLILIVSPADARHSI